PVLGIRLTVLLSAKRVQPDSGYGLKGELRTATGSQQIGLVSGRPLTIEGRKISRGDAVALPNRTPGVDGLLPISLFKAIYICNSGGYLVFRVTTAAVAYTFALNQVFELIHKALGSRSYDSSGWSALPANLCPIRAVDEAFGVLQRPMSRPHKE